MITKNLVNSLNKIMGSDESLGKVIKSIRLCDEMTQKEFADVLGITVSYLSDLENGRKIASAKKAYEYAEKLGYSVKEFVRLALQDEVNSLLILKEKNLHANIMLELA